MLKNTHKMRRKTGDFDWKISTIKFDGGKLLIGKRAANSNSNSVDELPPHINRKENALKMKILYERGRVLREVKLYN